MQARLTHTIKYVGDMDKAVAFYRDTFGLTLRFASPGWSEFDTGDVTLALHLAAKDIRRAPASSALRRTICAAPTMAEASSA